jgi:hypothetical protein
MAMMVACSANPVPETTGPDFGGACAGPCDVGGRCAGLDEATCVSTAGCHGWYMVNGETSVQTNLHDHFGGCWTITAAPVGGGNCDSITDAATCAAHDDCVTIMHGPGGDLPDPTAFDFCRAEVDDLTPEAACATLMDERPCQIDCYPCPDGTDTCATCATSYTSAPSPACTGVDCGPSHQCAAVCNENDQECQPRCLAF